nr:YdcF family protein [[Leptolyngbya] sp. PCC 7376]
MIAFGLDMTLSNGKFARKQTTRIRRSPNRKKKHKRRWLLALSIGTAISAGSIVYYKVKQILLKPEAIFVLGGHEEREKFAAQLAQNNPALEVWVSSGSPPDYAKQIFEHYDVSGDRLHLDYKAQDTVTNFTSIVNDFKQQNIDSVYLITSENHMHRAQVIAQIVFGSQGIVVKPMPVPSQNPPESRIKCFRDGLRSIWWVFTGETGAEWMNKKSATVVTTKNL